MNKFCKGGQHNLIGGSRRHAVLLVVNQTVNVLRGSTWSLPIPFFSSKSWEHIACDDPCKK